MLTTNLISSFVRINTGNLVKSTYWTWAEHWGVINEQHKTDLRSDGGSINPFRWLELRQTAALLPTMMLLLMMMMMMMMATFTSAGPLPAPLEHFRWDSTWNNLGLSVEFCCSDRWDKTFVVVFCLQWVQNEGWQELHWDSSPIPKWNKLLQVSHIDVMEVFIIVIKTLN